MLNVELPLSSLRLQVLIANFFVFMVLSAKSRGFILQILYSLQCLYLKCVALYLAHSSILCTVFCEFHVFGKVHSVLGFFEACAEVLAFICFICCCFERKSRFYSCIIVVSYFKFIWLLENKLTELFEEKYTSPLFSLPSPFHA